MKWHEYFFKMCALVAEKSKDPSSQIGCVIVGPDNEVRSTGYNGFARGLNDDKRHRYERPGKYLWTEHAERNAIYNAARVGIPLKGSTIYMQYFPCADCARAIIQAGITTAFVKDQKFIGKGEHWDESLRVGAAMMLEAGVNVLTTSWGLPHRFKLEDLNCRTPDP